VNVQLIDANTDEHIWAEDYDRDLTDVFAIQTDLAQKISSVYRQNFRLRKKRTSIAGQPKIRMPTCFCPGA
jgi:hypothetical protein